jgi:hypothetical protein
MASGGYRGRRKRAFRDGGEQTEINRTLERCGFLEGAQCLEYFDG